MRYYRDPFSDYTIEGMTMKTTTMNGDYQYHVYGTLHAFTDFKGTPRRIESRFNDVEVLPWPLSEPNPLQS